jgi:hypothetical protein
MQQADDNFADELVELVNSTITSIKSVYMDQQFLSKVDQLLAEIPINVGDATQDEDVNTSDTT